MESISINPIPSDKFKVTLGGNSYDIKLFSIEGHMAYDISIDDTLIISGFKMVNDILLLPYRYQEVNGNILLTLPDDEIPDYKKFNTSQFLFYLDEDETVLYRESTGL